MPDDRDSEQEASARSPRDLLRAHVRSVLAYGSIPSEFREDVEEELYGHLWQRWHEGVAAGLEPLEAARAAIAAFGGPDRVGRGLTGAFHGRLYASTIGVLLPTVVPPPGRPKGLSRSRALIGLTAAFFSIALLILVLNETLTPLRELLFVAFAGLDVVLLVLAYRALLRQQRWALRFLQILAPASVIQGLVQLFQPAITIDLLALLALVVVPVAFGDALRGWVSSSRPLGTGLAIVVLVGALGPWAVGPVVAALPDPTVAEPSDVSMIVHVECPSMSDPSQPTGAESIQVDLVWSRTDLLPYGPLGFLKGMRNSDYLQAAGTFDQAAGTFDGSPSLLIEDGSYVDLETGSNASLTTYIVSSNAFFRSAGNGFAIDPATIRAGWHYRATFSALVIADPDLADAVPVFTPLRVTYDHQHRWGLEAYANCGQTVTASPVTTPDPQIVFQ